MTFASSLWSFAQDKDEKKPRKNPYEVGNGGAIVLRHPKGRGSLDPNMRDDILWHAEAANVVYRNAGNVSLLSASRYGLSQNVELSTYLAEDVLRPTIYVKALWKVFDKKWFLSSRFDLANAYPGMKLAQRLDVERIISQDDKVPLVFEGGHELLFSRAWFSDPNCSDGSVYLVLTGGLGLYGSYNFSNLSSDSVPDLRQFRFHFLANRGETLRGCGFRGRAKIWADAWLLDRFAVHGGVAVHFGSFRKHCATELQLEAEYFLRRLPKLSVKAGALVSFANYQGIKSKAAIWPIVDLSWYFGRRKNASSSLFGKDLYKRSKF